MDCYSGQTAYGTNKPVPERFRWNDEGYSIIAADVRIIWQDGGTVFYKYALWSLN